MDAIVWGKLFQVKFKDEEGLDGGGVRKVGNHGNSDMRRPICRAWGGVECLKYVYDILLLFVLYYHDYRYRYVYSDMMNACFVYR